MLPNNSTVHDIVFLAQRVPYPPDRGDRITTWNICRHFLEEGHKLRIACLLEREEDAVGVKKLESMGAEVMAPMLRPFARSLSILSGFWKGSALTLPWFRHETLQVGLRKWLTERPPSLCFAYSSSMGQYLLENAEALRDTPKLMHFAELDSDKWMQYAQASLPPRSWVYARESRLLLKYERELATSVDMSFVVSEVEKELFCRQIPGAKVTVLPNGVDLNSFTPGPFAQREPDCLIFTGVMNYRPNVDGVLHFVKNVWPGIRRRKIHARFLIVGSEPLRAIQKLDGQDGICVSGRVPSTIPWFHRACVAVIPLRIARGIQNKILEAMAMALPVVASAKAFQGIHAQAGRDLFVSEDDASMCAKILQLLDDAELRRAMGERARLAMEKNYAWTEVLSRLTPYL